MQPAMQVGPAQIRIETFEGSTDELDRPRRATRHPLRLLKRRRTVETSGCVVFDTRYEIDTNVGHYLVDTVPKILVARRLLAERYGADVEVRAVLREGSTPMSRDVFAAFGIPTLATEATVRGRILSIAETRPDTFMEGRRLHASAPPMAGGLVAAYADFRERLAQGAPTPERIFVSRRDSRTIENEAEVASLLAGHGFQKLLFEAGEMPLLEQWRAMAGARRIVAIHGAGLTPLIFNGHGLERLGDDRSGLRIVELHGAGYFVDFNRRLAAIVNAHWCGVRGRITPAIVRDLDERGASRSHQASPFRVDLGALELALRHSEGCGRELQEARLS